DAHHRVEAALDRRRAAHPTGHGLVALGGEEPGALLVHPDEVGNLVDVDNVAGNPLQDLRPLLEVRLRGRSLEPDAHRTVAANTPPPPRSPVPLPTYSRRPLGAMVRVEA